jgi:hypothetical protein
MAPSRPRDRQEQGGTKQGVEHAWRSRGGGSSSLRLPSSHRWVADDLTSFPVPAPYSLCRPVTGRTKTMAWPRWRDLSFPCAMARSTNNMTQGGANASVVGVVDCAVFGAKGVRTECLVSFVVPRCGDFYPKNERDVGYCFGSIPGCGQPKTV